MQTKLVENTQTNSLKCKQKSKQTADIVNKKAKQTAENVNK